MLFEERDAQVLVLPAVGLNPTFETMPQFGQQQFVIKDETRRSMLEASLLGLDRSTLMLNLGG
jgi:hypothetical protein